MIDPEKILRKGGIKLSQKKVKQMTRQQKESLDRYITGNYGEDQFNNMCPSCGWNLTEQDIENNICSECKFKFSDTINGKKRVKQIEKIWIVEFEGGKIITVPASHRDEAMQNARKFLKGKNDLPYEIRSLANGRIVKAYPMRR